MGVSRYTPEAPGAQSCLRSSGKQSATLLRIVLPGDGRPGTYSLAPVPYWAKVAHRDANFSAWLGHPALAGEQTRASGGELLCWEVPAAAGVRAGHPQRPLSMPPVAANQSHRGSTAS